MEQFVLVPMWKVSSNSGAIDMHQIQGFKLNPPNSELIFVL